MFLGVKTNKFLEGVKSQDVVFDSDLSDFEEISTPYPRSSAHLSDTELSRGGSPELFCPAPKEGIVNLENDTVNDKTTTSSQWKQMMEQDELLNHLRDYYEAQVQTSLDRKSDLEDTAFAVTHKVLRKVQTVDQRFRANSLVPHGIPYDGLKVGEPIVFEMILQLSLDATNTLYVKKTNDSPFVRIKPMSVGGWVDCATGGGFLSASRVQHVLRRYVRQTVHVLRKYINQGKREKLPNNLNNLSLEEGQNITLIINNDIRVRLLPAFSIPDCRSDFSGKCCPSSSHVVSAPKTSIPHDMLSMIMESPGETEQENCFEIAWRVSFYVAEKNKMRALGYGCRIRLLRILTEIKDNHETLRTLSSYHLKTILFYVTDDIPDVKDWTDAKMSARFLDLLKRLKKCLEDGFCPHYFLQPPDFPQVNLFEEFREEALQKMDRVVNKITQNPISILSANKVENGIGTSQLESKSRPIK